MAVKVLILEDNPITRGFLCRVITDSFSDAIELVEVEDLASARRELALGPDGLPPAGATPFQLMLLDLELPDGNSLGLLRELRHYPATRVVTTLYPDDEHLFPALQAGVHGYLLKEGRFEVLVEDIQRIVRGQLPMSANIARQLLHHFRGGDTPSGFGSLSGAESRPTGSPPPIPLEPKEGELLTFLSKGFTFKEISSLMGIKWFTVNDHIKAIYRKLSASSY